MSDKIRRAKSKIRKAWQGRDKEAFGQARAEVVAMRDKTGRGGGRKSRRKTKRHRRKTKRHRRKTTHRRKHRVKRRRRTRRR